MMLKILRSKNGEGYVDIIVIVMSFMLVIIFAIKTIPVLYVKHQLNIYANEICRTAEITGSVDSETTIKAQMLSQQTGLDPDIQWETNYISGSNKIQLNEDITVILSYEVDIGLFGSFGSFPIHLISKACGRSEVYWK